MRTIYKAVMTGMMGLALATLGDAAALAQKGEPARSDRPPPVVPKAPTQPASTSTRLPRPAGPEPSEIDGIIRLTDPQTGALHVALQYDRVNNVWPMPMVTFRVVFSSTNAPDYIMSCNFAALAFLNADGSRMYTNSPDRPPAALRYAVPLIQDRLHGGAPDKRGANGIVYNPDRHRLTALEFNDAAILTAANLVAATGVWNRASSLTPRVGNWPGLQP